jgi:succinate dehydrogenase/fumarate reductase flavoprotein subunit
MMEWAKGSLEKVAETRKARSKQTAQKLSDSEADALLKEFHPDYLGMERTVSVGPNTGAQKFPLELAELLESDSVLPQSFEPAIDITTDVLIIGGGGAGVSASLTLAESGLSVHLATKLRLGDANTVMAEGGIQAALGPEDSPRRHYADSLVGGHGNNDPELLRFLCEEGPKSIRWLSGLGCLFDQTGNGTFRLRAGGGTSIPRVLACRDYTGLEIMRVLKDAVRLTPTKMLEDHAAVELTDDGKGQVTGAVLWDRAAQKLVTVSARAVILATGGSGQLRLQGFPTSNHLGATGDGLILAYRQGCALIHTDSFQYHPSGSCYPEALAGQLVTESIRSIGAQLLNVNGERFIDEMTYRDVVAGAIIREVAENRGVPTPTKRAGVWLDTPLIELNKGKGTLRRQFPGLIHRFERYGIDPAIDPILVYPTLHYQNGGIKIDTHCKTEAKGLWAAGEVTGGLHGSNRLMGNSLLDITVFGRRAAQSVVEEIPERGDVTLSALKKFREELKTIPHRPEKTAPLFFPLASNMTFQLAEKSSEEQTESNLNDATSEDKNFEPPDPFAGKWG